MCVCVCGTDVIYIIYVHKMMMMMMMRKEEVGSIELKSGDDGKEVEKSKMVRPWRQEKEDRVLGMGMVRCGR